MKLGLLSDVHGNRVALEAVLADGRSQGVDRWWVLGDVVAIGPEPVATAEVLLGLPGVAIISGNTDRYVLTRDRPPPTRDEVRARPELLELFASVEGSFAWTRGALAQAGLLDWLGALAPDVRETLPDGSRVLGVHASPGRDDGAGITPDRPHEELSTALRDAEAEIVCAGHTHRATDRQVGGVRAVNLGSVSNPVTDDLRASYVVIEADADGHAIEHRRVGYDRDEFLRRLEGSGHPEVAFIASFQLGGQVRHPALPLCPPGESGGFSTSLGV